MTVHIHVHGFGFTGSGALIDWMKDHPDIQVAPKIKGFMGKDGIAAILTAADDPEEQKRLVRRRLESVDKEIRERPLKTRLPGYQRGRALANAVKTRLGLGRRTGEHMTNTEVEGIEGWEVDRAYLRDFLQRLEAGEAPDGVAYWREWLQRRIAQYGGEAPFVALDKCLPFDEPAYDGVWEAVWDPVRVVVAHRDPVDQCAEIVRRLGWEKLVRKGKYAAGDREDVGGSFLETARSNLERLRDYQRRHPERCLAVPFEGFVEEHEAWSPRLQRWLGVPRQEPPRGHFDPAVSARNIGIGDEHPDVRELLEARSEPLQAVRALRAELDELSRSAAP